jgi:hypothetical protein
MKRISIIPLFLLLAAAAYGFDGATWTTAARLIISPNEYYSLDVNDAGNYRMFSSGSASIQLLGKGKKQQGMIVFAAPGQPTIKLFIDREDPEIQLQAASPRLLPFINGFTFGYPAAVQPLSAQAARLIAGSVKGNRILLEEVTSGSSPPPFVDATHYLYVAAAGGYYDRYAVTVVQNEGALVLVGQRKNDKATLTIDWDEQGRAIGKLVLPDKSVEFLDCSYFGTAVDQQIEEPEKEE